LVSVDKLVSPLVSPQRIGCSRHRVPVFPLKFELLYTFEHALIMANIVTRMILGSNSSSGSNKKIIRSREDIIHEDYLEWKIPNEKIDNIYSIGTFDFKTSYAIKIHEETFNIQNKFQTIPLLSTLAL